MKMHADEVATDAGLVRRLLRDQFPRWADLPIERVDSFGTDHDIYRLGEDLAVRLPRIGWAVEQAELEATWLPRLAPHLPLALPVPQALGDPGHGFPYRWSVCTWLPGHSASEGIDDLEQAAMDLAGFVTALRRIDVTGAPPPSGRGRALARQDVEVRRAIVELGDRIDGLAALRSWEESLDAAPWAGPDVWLHGDLLPGNLLVVDGRLSGVIDFGTLTIGDPACDLLPAWNVFAGRSREIYRHELQADEAIWLRGRGWALRQALVALPYYWDSNPRMVRQASASLAQVL